MTNEQVLEKMSKDMQMRNFSHYTYYAYMHKGKEVIEYFNKPIEEVTITEVGTDNVWNNIIPSKAATQARNMYDNTKPFTSDLMIVMHGILQHYSCKQVEQIQNIQNKIV